MVSLRRLLYFCLLIVPISQTTAQPPFPFHSCNDTNGNYTINSTYHVNLITLLSKLTASNTKIDYGFYNLSYGQNSDKVSAIGMCRGDNVEPDDCRRCLYNSTASLPQLCPNQKEAIRWDEKCMLRYSSRSIFGIRENLPQIFAYNENSPKDVNRFNQDLNSMLDNLRNKTASGDSRRKYAADIETGLSSNQIIYALEQCTPDLTQQDCDDCLAGAISFISYCCYGKEGAVINQPSCILRFESYPFFNYTADASPRQVPPPPSSHNNTSTQGAGGNNITKIILATVIPTAAVATLLAFVYYSCYRQKRRQRDSGVEASDEITLKNLQTSHLHEQGMNAADEDNSREVYYFSLSTIKVATNNFSDENKLGEGGFGPVFKGELINGKEIAVKRLSFLSRQGLEEFKNEVMVIAKLQHKNLVRLLGCCLEENEKLLVYEYLANTSLDAFLFDPTKRKELDWPMRAKIINGVARGLLYLHEDSRLKIIHRDLKASNILLDKDMNPKISDFGTARIFGGNQIEANTDKVVGTYCYMAPEYAMEGLFSIKSDVFSFGVLLLEIVSGKKNGGFYQSDGAQSLLSHAWRLWSEDNGIEFVDPDLVNSCPIDEALRWIHIGILCVQDDPNYRPTMSSVVLMLGSNINLPRPFAAPFSAGRFLPSDQSSINEQSIGFLTSSTAASS